MPSDAFSQVLFNDGEGVVFSDMNNIARFADAKMNDQIFARCMGNLGQDGDPDIHESNGTNMKLLAYTLRGGECVIKQGTTATRIGLTPGTIFQRFTDTYSDVDGEDAAVLAYSVSDSDVDLTVAAGDATHPRITILQMKLEYVDAEEEIRDIEDAVTEIVTDEPVYKKRRVQATFSLKNGTPAATPTYPAPDTDYCMIGAMRVPAAWTTGVTANLRQCTIPLNISQHRVMPCHFDYGSGQGANWALNAAGYAQATGGAGTNLVVWAPRGSNTQRIVAVEIVGVWVTSGSVMLQKCAWNSITYWGPTGTEFDLSSQLVTTGGTTQSKFAHLADICDASSDSNPVSAGSPVGDPMWCAGGCRGPSERRVVLGSGGSSGSAWGTPSALIIDAGQNTKIVEVVFYLAG